MSDNSTVTQLQQQVSQLTALVEKQNKLILSTGERLMALEVRQQKKSVSKLNSASQNNDDSSSDDEDEDNYATNEDLVQLVGELQGQLTNLDHKSVNRVNNSSVKDSDSLAMILNADGEVPPQEIDYPKTKSDFATFTDLQIFKLASFYELVPQMPNQTDSNLEAKIKEMSLGESKEDPYQTFMDILGMTKKDKDDLFNTVAAYLGINTRK